MADALVSITILLTDNIRGCLQRAGKTEDLAQIRSILAEINKNVDQLVASAKAAERDQE
jgi:hypothetical protein